MKHALLLFLLCGATVEASYRDKKALAEGDPQPSKKPFIVSTCALAMGVATCYHVDAYGFGKTNCSSLALSFAAMAKPESAIALYGKITEKVYNCGSYLKTQISKASCCSSRPNRKR